MTMAGDRNIQGSADAIMDARQTLRWAWRILWRGKYIILACWLLAIVPTILSLQQATPLYTAQVTLVIDAPEATDAMNSRLDARWRLNENVIQTEVGILTSTMLARRVIDKLALDKDPEFNPSLRKVSALNSFLSELNPMRWLTKLSRSNATKTETAPATSMASTASVRLFQSRLVAQAQRRSFLISISFTSESREKAAKIADAVAEVYVLDRLEASFDDAKRVTGWLADRIRILQTDVQIAEAAVEEFRSQNGLRRKGDRQITVNDQQLSELNTRLVVARTDLAQKQARLDQVRTLIKSSGNIASSYDALQSQLIQRMREQETTLVREMADALNIYGERHPRLVAYRADLEELRRKIETEMQRIAQAIANEVDVASAGVRTLERELGALRSEANVEGGAEVRLRELERQAEATRSLYEAFLQRFKRDAESQGGIQRANARIITQAEIPSGATFPQPARTLSLVSLLALGFGLLLVFVLDRLDNAIRSSDEAEEVAGVPTLAVVPIYRGDKNKMMEELANNPRSAIADALRNLRVTLEMQPDGSEGNATRPKIVALTSSVPKEGKTFAALCLAVMCARSSGRVLLIDADIHRPRLHTMVKVENERGLLQLMDGTAKPEDVIIPSIAPQLDFLPAGSSPNVADQIREDDLGPLLRRLAEQYDRVIIDLPPVLAVTDARVLASLADRVIYLVHWNSTPRDAVRNGIKLLRDARVKLHGVVLSQMNQKKHSRYGYGDYGSYYGRYREYYTK